MALIAQREFDMDGDEPKLAALTNEMQSEIQTVIG